MASVVVCQIEAAAATYFVRHTVGNDGSDGLSAATAWRSLAKLSTVMHAGDTAYIGPGLYREQIVVSHDGTAAARLVFVADTTGQRTGDPAGVVMITGAEAVDESIFLGQAAPGVYAAKMTVPVLGVVEMDGPQRRYRRARDTPDHLVDKLAERDVVAKLAASHLYDEDSRMLYIHTSDGGPPNRHEIELIRRGAGISMTAKHFVTVMGFTFRHMGDAGISVFRSSDAITIGNTSYGSRQGIRVYDSPRVLVYGNTLFRNDNSGVYFALQSSDGVAIANVAYENVKGARWSSQSVHALAIDNTVFENAEAGIAIENADRAFLRRNVMVNNAGAQLMVIRSEYGSEDNCFESRAAAQLTADFVFVDRYRTLADYQRGKHQDLHSREGGCGPLPEKVDVLRLHTETLGYAERARAPLSGSAKDARPSHHSHHHLLEPRGAYGPVW